MEKLNLKIYQKVDSFQFMINSQNVKTTHSCLHSRGKVQKQVLHFIS